MAEWAFNIATMEYGCPRCGAAKGETCRTPAGRKTRTPHGERVHQLSKADWDRCRVGVHPVQGFGYPFCQSVVRVAEALGAPGQPVGIQSGEGPR